MKRVREWIGKHPKLTAAGVALLAALAFAAWRWMRPEPPAPAAPVAEASAAAQGATTQDVASSAQQTRRGAARAVHTTERDPATGAIVKDEVRLECEDSSRQQQGSSSSTTSAQAAEASAKVSAPAAASPAKVTRLRLTVGPEWTAGDLRLRPDVPLEAAGRPFKKLPVEVYARTELRDAPVRELVKGTQFGARLVLEWP